MTAGVALPLRAEGRSAPPEDDARAQPTDGTRPSTAANQAVSCRAVQVRFFTDRGTVTALQGLSLDVAVGEFLTLLGPSGCGKSTLLRVVADLIEPNARRHWLER